MGEGLVDFLIIFVVAVAAIVQSVVAKKKTQQRQGGVPQRAPGRSGLPEMTGSASAEDSDGPVDIFTQLARAGAEREAQGSATEEEDSSEDLIPKEIWREIAELAVGRRAPEPPPPPPPEAHPTRERAQSDEAKPDSWEGGRMREADLQARLASAEAEKSPVPDRSKKLAARHEGEVTRAQPHVVAATTTRVSTPAPDLELEVTEGERGTGRMEWLFGGKSPETLRRAILLREVLDLPLALREEEET